MTWPTALDRHRLQYRRLATQYWRLYHCDPEIVEWASISKALDKIEGAWYRPEMWNAKMEGAS